MLMVRHTQTSKSIPVRPARLLKRFLRSRLYSPSDKHLAQRTTTVWSTIHRMLAVIWGASISQNAENDTCQTLR